MSLLKKLAGQTALYGLSSMLGRAVNFLLVPFYTGVLGSAEFGVMTEMYAYVAFLNVLYLYGMETSYFRFANKGTYTEMEAYNLSQTALFYSSTAFSVLFCLLAVPLSFMLDYPGHDSYILWLSAVLWVDAVVAIPFARLRFRNQASRFAIGKLANIFLNIFFNIFFLVICAGIVKGKYLSGLEGLVRLFYVPGHKVEYVFVSNLLANVFFIFYLRKELSDFKFVWNWNALKPMVVYGYPLLFMGLAGMVNEMLSRITLKYWLPKGFYPGLTNEQALGIFGACYKLSMFMTLAVQAFRYASEPFFFANAKDKNSPELFASVMKWFIILCCLMFLFVSLYLDWFGLLLRREVYREGLYVVPMLLMANLFLGMYYNLSIWYKLTDKTIYGTWISVGGALVTIILNWLLIPIWGYEGSAWATLICYALMAAVSYVLGQKYYPIPYKVNSALFYVLCSSFMVLFFSGIAFESGVFKFFTATLFFAAFLWLTLSLEKRELRKILGR